MVFRGGCDNKWRGGGWFVIVFYDMFCQKIDGVVIQGVSARTFSTRLYMNLWEHVVKTVFLNNEIGVQWHCDS